LPYAAARKGIIQPQRQAGTEKEYDGALDKLLFFRKIIIKRRHTFFIIK
jgi:hypothetical protein